MISVCDIVEYGLDCFGRRPETWRVTHHLKRVEDTLDKALREAKDMGTRITLGVCREFREKERKERRAKGLPANRRYKLVYCRPRQATHVSLVGVCGAIAPLTECKRLRKVAWDKEHRSKERANAVSKFWLSNNFPADWYWE